VNDVDIEGEERAKERERDMARGEKARKLGKKMFFDETNSQISLKTKDLNFQSAQNELVFEGKRTPIEPHSGAESIPGRPQGSRKGARCAKGLRIRDSGPRIQEQ
jgi:hypothetical protein